MAHTTQYWAWVASFLSLCTTFIACGGSDNSLNNVDPCDQVVEGGCGTPCASDANACASGFFCGSDGLCTADCVASTGAGCGDGLVCNERGACVDELNNGNICAEIDLDTDELVPNVTVIIDQSSSMNADFGGSENRWSALKEMLIGNRSSGGLIYDLQSSVAFAIAMYTAYGTSAGQAAGTECPIINNPYTSANPDNTIQNATTPSLNAYDTIADLYGPAELPPSMGGQQGGADTPTGDTIRFVTDYVQNNPPAQNGPNVFILATDGRPDRCEQLDPNTENGNPEAFTESIEAIEAAYDLGISTFAVAVADANEIPDDHMQDLANAGAGQDNAEYYRVNNADQLAEDVENIVRGARSCRFVLQGTITDLDQMCTGTVTLTLDGETMTVPCGTEDGWRAPDANHIELLGQSCEDYKASNQAILQGTFPCDVASDFTF